MTARFPASGLPQGSAIVGIGLTLAAMAILPVMDGLAKHLGAHLTVAQIVWGRMVFSALLLAPAVVMRHGMGALLPRRTGFHLVRTGLLLASNGLFIGALVTLPVADALALFFVYPLAVTALSPLLLGETVGVRRWSAVAVGFAGMLIIVRPGFQALNLGTLMALASGVTFALSMLMTRQVAGSAPPLVTAAFTAIAGAILMSPLVPLGWVAPAASEWLLLAAVGAISAAGHYLLVKAYEHGEAGLLAPLAYSEMIMAVVVGYVGFGDLPDRWTVVGVAVLIAAAIYIAWREWTLGRATPRRDAPA
jgi:drug/metabolite transporter (DMT)-like permease